MNREMIQNILLTVFAVVIVLMGWMLYVQNRTIVDFNDRLNGFSQSMTVASMRMDDAVQKIDEMGMKADEGAMLEEGSTAAQKLLFNAADFKRFTIARTDLVHQRSLGTPEGDITFLYPAEWAIEIDELGVAWSFKKDGRLISTLACPDDNSPGPAEYEIEELSRSYFGGLTGGAEYKATIRYMHFLEGNSWINSLILDDGQCSLGLGNEKPTSADRALHTYMLESVGK